MACISIPQLCTILIFRSEFLFHFNNPFEIHDDIEILKRIGLAHGLERGEVSEENLKKIKAYVPIGLHSYVDEMTEGGYVFFFCLLFYLFILVFFFFN